MVNINILNLFQLIKTTGLYFQIFDVIEGKRYRMRLISNVALSCPIQFSVDHHNMTMISSDGKAFEPFEVKYLI